MANPNQQRRCREEGDVGQRDLNEDVVAERE